MKKNIIAIMFFMQHIAIVLSQNEPIKIDIIGFWDDPYNDNSYYYYASSGKIYPFSFYNEYIDLDYYYYYGFYMGCDLPSIDSLSNNGEGDYFEVSEDDWDESGNLEPYVSCGELSIFEDKGEIYMNIYYSDRQQWSTYQKVKKLPTKLEKFLKKEHKDVYKDYLLSINGREITTPKTYIYTAPNLKGKMYLLKGDIVTVLEEEKDFVKFEYETDKERIITGYLKKEDLE